MTGYCATVCKLFKNQFATADAFRGSCLHLHCDQAKHGIAGCTFAYASLQQTAHSLQQHSVHARQVVSSPMTVYWLGAHVGATNPAAIMS